MARRVFRLPDLGEGLAEAEIVQWLVAPGDQVEVNQPLVEVETAKAVVELPSPFAGRLVSTEGAEGDTVSVGAVLVTVEDDEPAEVPPPAAGPPEPVTADGEPRATLGGAPGAAGPGHGGREPMLVGYGPRAAMTAGRIRRRRYAVPAPPAAAGSPAGPTVPTAGGGQPPAGGRVLAKPPVRHLARELGVDLGRLTGSGPAGTISRADVEAAAHSPRAHSPGAPAETSAPPARSPRPAVSGTAVSGPEVPAAALPPVASVVGAVPANAVYDDASRTWDVPVSGVRRATARAMVTSAFSAPHATEFVTVDLTETLAALDHAAGLPEFAGVRATPLLFVAKALLVAVRRHPLINASWVADGAGDPRIVVSEAVNLGIAVASPRGLLVPNIRDADRLDLAGLARALRDLAERTRAGQARPADLTGGTITITNIGVFGVDIGTPILNPGEAAILAVGAVRQAPWVHEGQLAVRSVCQLALSFDHRLVDGELGSVVLADVAAMLTSPTRLLAWS